PVGETPTPGYDDLRAEGSYTRKVTKPNRDDLSEMTFGVTGTNLLNQDIRNSVSYTKDQVLLPGQAVRLFGRLKYGHVFSSQIFRTVLRRADIGSLFPALRDQCARAECAGGSVSRSATRPVAVGNVHECRRGSENRDGWPDHRLDRHLDGV